MRKWGIGKKVILNSLHLCYRVDERLSDFSEFGLELGLDPSSEVTISWVGGGSADGGMVDTLFVSVVTWEAGNDRNVA